MKKLFAIVLLLGTCIAQASVWEPPVGSALQNPASTECILRFGKHGSASEACKRTVDICQNWFGLTGQRYQDCQEATLLFHGIRESDYPL